MTAHTHTVFVEGCYRCDLSKDEAADAAREILAEANECRRKYGEAHDAHMHMNGECPWCGQSTYNEEG